MTRKEAKQLESVLRKIGDKINQHGAACGNSNGNDNDVSYAYHMGAQLAYLDAIQILDTLLLGNKNESERGN